MSEMTHVQVRDYCEMLKTCLAPKGFFFEQNQDNTHINLLDAEQIIRDFFPYRRFLSPYVEGRSQGKANLWGLEPIELQVITHVALRETDLALIAEAGGAVFHVLISTVRVIPCASRTIRPDTAHRVASAGRPPHAATCRTESSQ
jgi:hypothetical protein